MKEILGTLNVDVLDWRTEMGHLAMATASEKDELDELTTSFEKVSLRSPQQSRKTSDKDAESVTEQFEEEEGVLVFRVRLAQDTDDQIALLHLEDLRDQAPELLIRFLQTKLRFIDEEEDNLERS